MPKQTNSLWMNIAAGGAAGAIVAGLIVSNPQFVTRAPAISTPQSSSGTNATSDFEASVISTVKAVKPAVVSVVITKDVPVFERRMESLPNDIFGNFFGGPFTFSIPRLQQNGTKPQEVGGGSGFIVSADGTIITNKHVVDQQDAEYTVFTNDGTKYAAKVVAKDPLNDVAILKIDAHNLPYLEFADSSTLDVGQSVIAIGNALGEFRNSVSLGIVSGVSRSITAGSGLGRSEQLDEVIQTDAAINTGNSGGPLLNLQGQVVGVNVAIALGSQNVGFALPSNAVKQALDSVNKEGKIVRPFIGVRYVAITPQLKEENKLSVDTGLLVVRGDSDNQLAVVPGSPADKAGITENDIILEVDGEKMTETSSLTNVIRSKKVGDTISVKLLHKGSEKTVRVTLEAAPE